MGGLPVRGTPTWAGPTPSSPGERGTRRSQAGPAHPGAWLEPTTSAVDKVCNQYLSNKKNDFQNGRVFYKALFWASFHASAKQDA